MKKIFFIKLSMILSTSLFMLTACPSKVSENNSIDPLSLIGSWSSVEGDCVSVMEFYADGRLIMSEKERVQKATYIIITETLSDKGLNALIDVTNDNKASDCKNPNKPNVSSKFNLRFDFLTTSKFKASVNGKLFATYVKK